MAQRYDIVKIDFQANARGANAAIESLRKSAEDCQDRVKQLKKDLADGIKMGKSTEEIENIRKSIAAAQKEARSFQKGYDELAKGMRTLDTAIKAFNDGSLAQMSQAFQKAANNAARLTRTKLDPLSDTYKEDYRQLTALMDATQQNFARMQGDAQQMVKTLKDGGKVSVAALQEEIKAQQELLSVLAQTDKGYQQTEKRLAVMQHYLREMGGDYEFVRQNITDTKKVSDDMLRNMYAELQKTNQEGKVTKDIMRENAAAMKEIRTEQARRVENVLGGNLGQQSEQSIRAAIANAKELLVTYKSNSKEAQTLSAQIVNAEEHLRTHGIEAARVAQREAAAIKTQEEAEKQLQATMNKRLQSLKTLSADALAETRKYWEAQRNGAEQGTTAYKKAEDALRRIDNLQKSRRVGELDNILGDPSKHGIAEVRNAVQEMEKLRDSVQQGIPAWQHYNKMVEQGKAYLDNLAKSEAAQRINQQMQSLSTLSATGLQEVKRYWETMVAGAAHGSTELDQYRAKLEQVMAEEKARSAAQAQQRVGILGGNLGGYSEAEIRQAIEAGKELIQTYKTASPEADALAKKIVAAENHLKQYGVEAERAAVKEAEAIKKAAEERRKNDALMEAQLSKGSSLTQEALKAQEQYWQRLINDPKTASASLAQYQANLDKVRAAQQQMMQQRGQDALNFFRGDTSNASADQIKQQADAMKKYRDSLPQKDNAAVIAEIDGYLQEAAAITQKATEQTMTWKQAMQVSAQAGTGSFKGTTEQLNQAKKTLEDMSAKAVKGGLAWRRMQEALQRIELELKNVGTLSKEVQAVLDQPKGKSFNALKQAVEQGRLALNAMDRSTKEGQKRFEELAAKVKAADIEMKNLGNSSKGTASAFDKAWSRLKTYVGLYVGAAVAMQKLTAAMGDLLTLSDKMGEVRKTTGFTADEVGRLSNNLAKLDTRTTLTQLMELSSLAGSVGLKTQEQVQGFTEAADQLIVALPELGNESARTIIKIANATGDLEKNGGDVRETLEKVGSTIIALRANSASAAGPITDFVSRVGAVGAQAGISIDQIAALGSTIDALGGRVEMSATALSRMIPAIKNNSFAIANSIGVTEKYLKSLAPMEQMVLIFQKMRDNIQHIDTSTEEGMNAMADNVEAMLGKNATMREVMKDLEQQGARAGIVFGLLSQNVDELQKQLGIASEAYRENTALANEFNNMNETTAAKWERLKNQVEEMFVGDSAQRFLGGIIDGLRKIVDLLTGNGGVSVALRSILMYIALVRLQIISVAKGALTSLGSGLKNIGIMLGFIKGEMTALQWGNIFTAAAAAVAYFAYRLKQTRDTLAEARKELGRWAQEILKSEQAVEQNFVAVDKARKSIDEANKKVLEARAALEKARKEMDGSKESAERLKKAEDDLKKAEEGLASANDAHCASIEQINKLYGSYLGFMLSEVARSEELINARDLINAKLRETITLKRKEAALSRIEENNGGKRDEAYGELSQALSGAIRQQVVVGRTKDKNGKIVEQKGWTTNAKASEELLREITKLAQAEKMTAEQVEKALANAGLNIYEKDSNGKQRITAYGANLRNLVMNYRKEYLAVEEDVADVERQFDAQMAVDREDSQKYLKKQYREAEKTYALLEENHAKAQGDAKKKAAADLLKQSDTLQDMIKNAKSYYDLNNEDEQKSYDKFISDSQKRIDGIEAQREALMKEAGNAYKPMAGSSSAKILGSSGPTNPYGTYNRVTSPYQDWDADALVSRRKEMLERVRALANGADVQAVLSEDAKFITEATRKNIKTTRDAIEWYNTERLKIQDALHEKHLTNTGDWKDPEKGGSKKPKFYENDYALAELDRYYSRRKEALEKAREEENMTEELYNREVELLEQEHLAKRSKLRETFTSKDKQMIEQFRQWWATLAETGDLAEVPWATVESEWSKATDAQWGANNRKAQEDLTKLQGITVKHLNAIAKIIDKERPYDGITANLRDNLLKMDILLADYQKNGPTEDTAALVKAQTERLKFLLGEAETAYTSTIEDVLRRMGEAGMTAWAEEIRRSPAMQNALMAQLQTAYDEIQNAIKKEASLIKKQTDIWWNDIAQGQTQSRKGGFEKMLTDLGLSEDRVKRANQLIGAGQASERVADKLAIAQMKVRLQMQETYYQRMRQMWADRIASLRAQGKEIDAQHAEMSRNLSLAEEQKKLDEQRVAIANQLEESNNRLYTELREWADLLSSSLQSVFEASHAGDAEYFNERAKLTLTGKGGPGAGTYIVIDNEGTSDATAHYEYLDEREALERQHEIERENAQAEAWKKVMDDINQKMSETITDQLNAMLQNASIDANTDALGANTQALLGLTGVMGSGSEKTLGTGDMGLDENGVPNALKEPEETPVYKAPWQMTEDDIAKGQENMATMWQSYTEQGTEAMMMMSENLAEYPGVTPPWQMTEESMAAGMEGMNAMYQAQKDASDDATSHVMQNQQKMQQGEVSADNRMAASSQSMFSKMTQAANLYGVAYQAMSNDNLSTAQKFEMIALQAVGNAAIAALTTNLSQTQGEVATQLPGILGKAASQLGPIAGPIAFAAMSALLGGLMGLAVSKVAKSKSQIAQVTGASSVSAGRLATGMLTYAEGNVNEFTDPSSLTPGKQYNVDGADGKTYRAKYTGTNPRTHITNGPEFHLVGEAGREAIIDAKTTRLMQMDDTGIWRAIQTLYNGGSISTVRRRRNVGRGIPAFADGNVEEFSDYSDYSESGAGMSMEMAASLQQSIDRQSDLLERAITEGIKGVFNVYGKDGLVDSYDRGKKTLNRYGERY